MCIYYVVQVPLISYKFSSGDSISNFKYPSSSILGFIIATIGNFNERLGLSCLSRLSYNSFILITCQKNRRILRFLTQDIL